MTPLGPTLPEPLRPLEELALDLRWTWSHAGDALWRELDAGLWERTRNPWLILQAVTGARLGELASDEGFLARVRELDDARRQVLAGAGWFRRAHADRRLRAAYFSMEFGLHDAVPLYAGGLGILAGDHLKTASDLDVPLVGVGILWQRGYFRQLLDPAGRQQELYPHNEPDSLPVRLLRTAEGDPLQVRLALPGRSIRLRTWVAQVGRVPLYLLDANHPLNAPSDRGITETLYGSDPEIRLLQELVLGIGGWRLLEALGVDADVCHLNEGHAALVVIERARRFMQDHAVTFREALWATRAGNVFTTHTSVPAGFDTFGRDLIDRYEQYFDAYVRRLGLGWRDLLALGRRDPQDPGEPFSMALLALRGCARVNGVSRLHGEVSRRLFRDLFPRWPLDEVPVSHVTNGVHVPSWDSPGADRLWTAASGKDRWRGELDALASALLARPDEELWALQARERADLVRWVRGRLHRQLARRGAPDEELEAASTWLDAEALTLGFARRFTAYKRPNLLLHDPDRLERLLAGDLPVQLVVAGKAHPADGEGKRLIQEWMRFAARPAVRGRVVVLEDYDMTMARELVQGVDVWINTPRRPWEACGTSGMKVLVNGGLNLSVRDGWWDEAFAPEHGWALEEASEGTEAERDAREAASLYRLLEDEVVPLFYDRAGGGLPRGWLRRVRTSMAVLAPRYSSNRMLREYVEGVYLPAARDLEMRTREGARAARDLAAWEARIEERWSAVRFEGVCLQVSDGLLHARAEVRLGGLAAEDVRVELYADSLGSAGPVRAPMECKGTEERGRGAMVHHFELRIETDRPELHFTPRVRPFHPHARVPAEVARIAWAW